MSDGAGPSLTSEISLRHQLQGILGPCGRDPCAIANVQAAPDRAHSHREDLEATAGISKEISELRFIPPTEEETVKLRKVPDSIPLAAYSLCLVECAERASYYGARTVFSNFFQFPLPTGGNGAGAPQPGTEQTAGALGRGLQFTNAFVLLFQFLVCVVPIFGGWLADTKLGRYRVVLIGVWICGVSHILMIFSAIPPLLQAGKATGPFLISFFMLAFGTGIFKPNIAPTILDQYRHQRSYVKDLKSGEKVLVDPETTAQRILLIFYGLINLGSIFAIATTYAEKKVGYWLAFLLPGIVYLLLPPILISIRSRIVEVSPNGSELSNVFKIILLAMKRNKGNPWAKDFWNAAKPSVLAQQGITKLNGERVGWNDKLVEDVRRTVSACQIFLFFPIYNLNDGGVGSVASSQGSTMTTAGAPNDLLGNFNPLTIVVATPILSYVVYPLLHRYKIRFGRVSRIMFGFTLAWISGVVGAIIQWRVYKTSPCGYYATGCTIGNGVSPLSIWLQIPNVTLGALSECFCYVTAYELAYARSPKNMRALVTALFLFSNALSSALGLIITPAIADPHLIWVWAGPAIALFVQSCIFYWRYRYMDNDDFMTYEEGLRVGGG